ncbi:MAG TPA: hypothetical protein VFZ64_04020 [Nocardioidaceae bacterium]
MATRSGGRPGRTTTWGLGPAGRHDLAEGLVEPRPVVAQQVEKLVVGVAIDELLGRDHGGWCVTAPELPTLTHQVHLPARIRR